MKNVTPAAGQVWESGNVNKIIDEVTPSRVFYNGDCWESYNGFIIDNTFVPQSDLEWLAVNVNGVDVRSFYAKDTSSRDGYKVNGEDLIRNYGGKLVQSKQIELGLDEPQQKETKMIDLSKAEIGDKFIAAGPMFEDIVFELVFICVDEYVFKEGDSLHISDASGVMNGVVTLYKKHEPRWWLKDLPDAGLFGDSVMSILVSPHNEWNYELINGVCCGLSMLKMPKLKGDEYKLSKISIPDLKAWQEKIK